MRSELPSTMRGAFTRGITAAIRAGSTTSKVATFVKDLRNTAVFPIRMRLVTCCRCPTIRSSASRIRC